MIDRETSRRLSAWAAGKPMPYGETKHRHLARDEDALIVAFVRMGGESSPWGISWGHPNDKPRVETVPEARNRTLVSEMCASFAPNLLRHFRHPAFVFNHDPEDAKVPIRQIWLPNPTHLDMLQNLAFRYAFTKWSSPDQELLQQFGRLCNWLFQESQRPGQQVVVVGTELLRSGWTFPAESTRQGHLGFLLGWLETKGSRTARYDAAAEAEQHTIATSLDPALERSHLDDPVARWGKARRDDDDPGMKRAVKSIRLALEPELLRRWQLTDRAVDSYRKDRRRTNKGVGQLVEASRDECYWGWYRAESRAISSSGRTPFFPSVETDRNAAAAASRFLQHDAAAEILENALVHDDHELLTDAVQAGDALIGKLTRVTDEAPLHTGPGKTKTDPVWTMIDRVDRPLRVREGAEVEIVGNPKRTGRILSIDEASNGSLKITIVITSGKAASSTGTAPHDLHPTDRRLVGHKVAFVKKNMSGFTKRKSMSVWNSTTPGSWLTHSKPSGRYADVQPGDRDDRDDAAESS